MPRLERIETNSFRKAWLLLLRHRFDHLHQASFIMSERLPRLERIETNSFAPIVLLIVLSERLPRLERIETRSDFAFFSVSFLVRKIASIRED